MVYYEKPLPFYMTYPYQDSYNQEKELDFEASKIKSYYPKTAMKIQECVENTCDHMEYEGSMLYDEYPDRFMMRQLCDHICREVEEELQIQENLGPAKEELVQVLFFHELHRRRCRRRRCRYYF